MLNTGKALLALAFAFVCLATPAHADSKVLPPQAAFIQKLGDKALTSLTDKDIARALREKRTRALLREFFDVTTIGRFALGPAWHQATDAQKKEYFSLFEDMIVQTYATRFEDYSGQSFKVDGTTDGGGKDTLVQSRILQKDGPPVDVEWRVRSKDGQMKVVDVIVEKISMGVTQRNDFSSVIQAGGGTVEALLASMRTRQIAAATPPK